MKPKYRGMTEAAFCGGKRSYNKRGAITTANKRYRDSRVKLRIYPCGDHWHLTRKLRRDPNRKPGAKKEKWRYQLFPWEESPEDPYDPTPDVPLYG